MDPRPHIIADLDGWWLEVQCRCRLVCMSMRLAAIEGHGARLVTDYARRLRCRHCGERPSSAALTEDVRAGAHGHPGEKAPRYPVDLGERR